jgi:two-component system, NtrC family, nitrogen regulation sensor histidine kinase NtrY
MRLAPRLVLTFGFLAATTAAGLGLTLRHVEQQEAVSEFKEQVHHACDELTKEVKRQAERDVKLISNACHPSELVDKVAIELEASRLDESRTRLSQLVAPRRVAYDLDELLLGSSKGDIIGADPKALLGTSAKEIEKELMKSPGRFELRLQGTRAMVSSCRLRSPAGTVGLIGARHLDPLLLRVGTALGVSVEVSEAHEKSASLAQETCALHDDFGHALPVRITKSTRELDSKLARLDGLVLVAALVSVGVALLLSFILARSLGRPIEQLAREARKVASGEANPLKVRASGEIRDLALAFGSMIEDLARTRQRLADASRVAAWREVARRVAHEVKNPLAPIRAAVETLRRLRARNDPAFDDYFDEATRTVLDEVHRIANIVTEFTRFARLPRPKPQLLDLGELARSVLTLAKAHAPQIAFGTEGVSGEVQVRADRDQIVQVLTNLVQNATDALAGTTAGKVAIRIALEHGGDYASVSVTDNGPGIDPLIAPRLFEPYATTKSQGTGLGLAIAQRIALEHEGELRYVPASALSRGATFKLTLPRKGPADTGPDSEGPV